MSNNTTSSAANDNDDESLWQDLLGNKSGILLLGGGLLLVLINVIVFVGIDFRPSAWLFHLDIRYWSFYFSLFLWTAAVWFASEFTDFLEDYRPHIRLATATCALLVMIFALRSFSVAEYPLWIDAAIIIASFCIVRSLLLFYDYRYEGGENIDVEETQWFWGVSGFLLAGLLLFGIMTIIPVTTQIHVGMDDVVTESLLVSCLNGLQEMLRSGTGSFALRAFGLVVFVAAIAFAYVAGKWALIFLSRVKERWA